MKKVILLFLILLNWPGRAQEIEFEPLSGKEILSSGAILNIIQDSRDLIWLCTNSGLMKFDGIRFTVYKKDDRSTNTPSHDRISCICEDSSGILWFGTDTDGLNRFDPRTETFTHYRHNPDDPNSISHDHIMCLYQDRAGSLWIGTDEGLNRLNPGEKTFTRWLNDPGNPDSISNNGVIALHEDTDGNLWIGTRGGLNRLDPRRETIHRFLQSPIGQTGTTPYIFSIARSAPGALWIGLRGDGLIKFDTRTGTFINYRHDPGNDASLVDNDVYCLLLDKTGLLWVGTTTAGLCLFDPASGRFTRYRNDPNDPNSLCSDVLNCIYEDKTGIIWIGTLAGGGNKVDRRKRKFSHYSYSPGNPNGLNDSLVYCFYEDRDGILWIGYASKGMSKFDRKTGSFTHYRMQPGNSNGLRADIVPCIIGDDSGLLWIGTQQGGLHKFDPKQEKFTCYQHDPRNPQSLGRNSVRALVLDGSDLIVGTVGAGMNIFDPKTEIFTRFPHDPQDPTSISHNFIPALLIDRQGVIWAGTWGGGLNRFDKRSKTFTHFQVDPNDPVSISDNEVHCLCEDSSGVLWVGTGGGGLNRFDRKNKTFLHYTTAEGLPDDFINGILEDNQGNLWLSSNRGISRFDPRTKAIKNYNLRDGIQSYKFNLGAYLKTREGELLFGGINGFIISKPEQIENNPLIPSIMITDFKKFNRHVNIGGGSPLRKHVSYTDELVLSYKDNFFSLEFAALDYTDPSQNQYKYKMERLHDDWIYLGTRNDVNFTGLPPGTYMFRVKGSNNDGIWNETGAALRIIITPPFWATWWFRVLLVLAIFGLLLLWHQERMKRLTLKLKTETEMERFFTRFKISSREQEILQMVLDGKSNKDIEDTLYISLPTVKSHIYSAYKKIGVKNRLELINFIQRSIKLN